MTKTTKHKNQHVIIEPYNNIALMIKLLVAEKVFQKTLGHSSKDNSKSINTDLFQKSTAVLVKGIFLQNYICQT